MASTKKTRCPKCGGPAERNADDGITYCDNWADCGARVVEDKNYRPPDRRGAVPQGDDRGSHG
jgi:hypothetical protein